MAIEQRVDLGAATELDVFSESYIAWPFTMFGDDDNVYVFGRMNDPDGLGDPSHIIYTDDAGATFSLLEGSWSLDSCGAFYSFGMFMVAIRKTGNRAKVYLWNGSSFDFQSTATLNAGTKVKGMALDHRDVTVVLCSEKADSIMVVLSPYPYTTWYDITSNHQITNGVFAVQIL